MAKGETRGERKGSEDMSLEIVTMICKTTGIVAFLICITICITIYKIRINDIKCQKENSTIKRIDATVVRTKLGSDVEQKERSRKLTIYIDSREAEEEAYK